MYRIQTTDYGFNLVFLGEITASELENWIKDSEKMLKLTSLKKFGVIIDMRDLKPLKLDASIVMRRGQTVYKTKGMQKSAVLLTGQELKKQFIDIAKASGIYNYERYIDVNEVLDPYTIAMSWIEDNIDPDKKM